MGTNEQILLRAQAGIESSRGVAVAATRKVYAQFTPTYTRTLMDFADTSGTYIARRRAAYGRERVSFSALDIATFEDLPWWLLMAVDGSLVNGSTDGGSPAAYTRLFEPSLDTDELKSFTLEHGEAGNKYQSSQCMTNTLTLRFDADNDSEPGWMIDAEIMALNWEDLGAFTAALPDRSTEVIKARGTKVYIDDEGDTFGDTQLVAGLISASATITQNLHFKAFAEDERTATAGAVGKQQLFIDAQVTVEFDNDAEFGNYRSDEPVLRKIRLEREGSVIHDAVTNMFQLDIAGYWNSWSRGDRSGNLTATFGLAGFYDIGEGMMFAVNTVNSVAALP